MTWLTAFMCLASVWTPVAAHAQSIAVSPMDVLESYEAGEYDLVTGALTQAAGGDLGVVLEALERGASKWIDADGPSGRSRRRLIVATFALETAHAALDRRWDRSRALIDWGATLLAKTPPSEAERIWHLAALALCEGSRDMASIDDQLARLKRRFPDEPRILLGRAFIAEVQFWDEDYVSWGKADAPRAARALQAATAAPASRDEALLRAAYFRIYAGRPADALNDLKQIASGTDEERRPRPCSRGSRASGPANPTKRSARFDRPWPRRRWPGPRPCTSRSCGPRRADARRRTA